MTKPYKEKLNNVLQKRGRNVMASLTASSRCVGRTRTRGCTRQLIFKYVSYFNFSEKKKNCLRINSALELKVLARNRSRCQPGDVQCPSQSCAQMPSQI